MGKRGGQKSKSLPPINSAPSELEQHQDVTMQVDPPVPKEARQFWQSMGPEVESRAKKAEVTAIAVSSRQQYDTVDEESPVDTVDLDEDKRLAEDGKAYTREEFLSFFGEDRGPQRWDEAKPASGGGGGLGPAPYIRCLQAKPAPSQFHLMPTEAWTSVHDKFKRPGLPPDVIAPKSEGAPMLGAELAADTGSAPRVSDSTATTAASPVEVLFRQPLETICNGHADLQIKTTKSFDGANAALASVAIPPAVMETFVHIQDKVGLFLISANGSCIHVCGEVSGMSVRIRARVDKDTNVTKQMVIELIGQVAKYLEPVKIRLGEIYAEVRCTVGESIIFIQSKLQPAWTTAKMKILEGYASVQQTLSASPLVNKAASVVAMAQGRAGEIAFFVKDGYIHITSQIGNTFIYLKGRVEEIGGVARFKILERYVGSKEIVMVYAETAKASAFSVTEYAKGKASAAAQYSKVVAADKPVASSAAGGAVLLGASGGAAGLAAGGVAGAACGLPLALFTLGLSIPVGAMIGGGAGACAGAAAGSTAGAVGGGAAGYGYVHRSQIKDGVDSVISKVSKYGHGLRTRSLVRKSA